MIPFEPEQVVIERLIRWAESQPQVRAMLLTSSRATPGGPEDVFSDYDVILALEDILPFHQSRDWLSAFGTVLVLYRDPLELEDGCQKSGYVIQFEDGLKIDFNLWEVEILRRVAAAPELPAEFDAGYRLLLDKDGLAEGLKPPTYKAYIPVPPSEDQYRERVELFLLDATYVAKFLWRDDPMAARHLLENMVQQEHLLPMLEWHMEIEHGWTVKPGPYGRQLKRSLRPDLWAELESTYAGPGQEENWQALFKTIALMRKAALEVGERLGFTYPHEMERRTLAYIRKVKEYPMIQPEIVADPPCDLGENPLWHPLEKRLYWTDITRGRLYRYDPAAGSHEQCYQGEQVGGFTIQADGDLLLFMMGGRIAKWRQGRLENVVESIPAEGDGRFNDVIADPAGRVFCGSLSLPVAARLGRLYRLDTDGSLQVVVEGVGVSNGMGFTPDRRHMYYTDSHVGCIYLFDYDEQTGALANQRVWLHIPADQGVPDGMTVDAQGHIWSARWDGSALYHYTPEGVEAQRIPFPARKVSSVIFGGPDLSDMYITTALSGGERADEGPGAGALFRLRLGVRGLPEFYSRVRI